MNTVRIKPRLMFPSALVFVTSIDLSRNGLDAAYRVLESHRIKPRILMCSPAEKFPALELLRADFPQIQLWVREDFATFTWFLGTWSEPSYFVGSLDDQQSQWTKE